MKENSNLDIYYKLNNRKEISNDLYEINKKSNKDVSNIKNTKEDKIINFKLFEIHNINTQVGKTKYSKEKNKINLHIKYKYRYLLLQFLLFLISFTQIKTSIFRKLNNYITEITITIDETGDQKILNTNFYISPYEVLINGLKKDETNPKIYNLQEETNTIIMKFDTQITTCQKMFSELTNIKTIDLSNFDSSQVTDMSYMFKGCTNLEFINLTNIDTSSVKIMTGLFNNCKKLSSLDLSYFDTSSVTSISDFFFGCNSLTSLDISNFKTSKIVDMSSMFRNCNNLISLNLSNFDTSSVTSMEYMFAYCDKLEYLNVENFDTSKTLLMKYMFVGCKKLSSLDLSSFNTELVKETMYMFSECESLKVLNLSNFVGTSVETAQYMFNGCKELLYLELSNFKATSAKSMQNMFAGCEKLTELNLSNFETQKATNMGYMFFNCKQLKTLDISNFVTTSVTTMQYMFSGCENLVSLDLKNFDFTSCIRIDNMLSSLKSLIYFNIKSIVRGNKIQNSTDLFKGISTNLKYCAEESISKQMLYNLFKRDSECTDNCFQDNVKIIVENNECITTSCSEETDNQYEYNTICYDTCPENTHISDDNQFICKRDLICKYYHNSDKSKCFNEIVEGYYLKDEENKIIDKCHEDCKTCSQKETSENSNCNSCHTGKFLNFGNCVNLCKNNYETDEYGNNICKCSLNDKCKNCTIKSVELGLCVSCSENFYTKIDDEKNEDGFIDCYKDPEGYYLDLDYEIYKPCYDNCKSCKEGGNFKNNNCEECKEGFEFKEDFENDKNCYKKCNYYYYFDDNNNYNCTECNECPKEQSKLILEKGRCINECKNDNKYKNEYNNNCYEICPGGFVPINNICIKKNEDTTKDNDTDTETDEPVPKQTSIEDKETTDQLINTQEDETDSIIDCGAEDLFLFKSCEIEFTNASNKDKLISNIENDIINRKIEGLLNKLNETKEDFIIKNNDTIYQITTTENQNNNEYKNISTVKLGDCEDRLKEIYGINKNLSLIIFKIDYYSPDLLIPIIGYEIFHPENKSKLDLNHCKDILIELNIPVSIDEDNLFKYNPNSGYYADECVPSTSENGTDILLSDRKEEYNNNNLSLCQNNCSFNEYDTETKKASCECKIKNKIELISEIIDDKNILSSNFSSNDDNSFSNVVTMKCVYTLFTKKGLKSNIGSYILIVVTLNYFVASILFYKVGYPMLEKDINNIILEKEAIKKNISNNDINIYNKLDIKKPNKKRKMSKKKSSKSVQKNTNLDFPPKKKILNKVKHNKHKINECFSQSKIQLKDSKIFHRMKKSKTIKSNNINMNLNEDKKIIPKNNFIDYELNSFNYKEALKYDKRTYIEYYLSLIRTKHPILFSFIPFKDYNSMIIKVSLFFFSFCIYFCISALFFNNSTIHKIYKDGGSYNLRYSLPYIIYSFIIAHTLSVMLKYGFLSESNILEIKTEKNLEKAYNKVDIIKKKLIIKYIIYFVSTMLFLFIFWYYLSSFCAVYQNTQMYLIKNTIFSFLVSFIYPFVINLLPGVFRIVSLNKEKNKEFMFKISKILQFF